MRESVYFFFVLLLLCICLVSCGSLEATKKAILPSIRPEALRVTSTEDRGINDYKTIEVTPDIFFEPDASEPGTRNTRAAIRSAILINDGKMFFGNESNEFRALDMKTGEQKWLYMTDAAVKTLPVYENEKVIFHAENTLYILNAGDGAEIVKVQAEPDGGRRLSSESFSFNDSHTAVAEGVAYFAVNSGNIYGVDINTGKIVFEFKTDKPGPVASGVHYYEGKLYFTDAGAQLRCIGSESGEAIFTTLIKDRIFAPMTFDEGKIYLGGRSCLFFCIDANNGEILWSSFSADSTTWFSGGSVVIDDTVYACVSDEHALPSFNKNTGEFKRIYPTESNSYTMPVLNGKNIVLAASDVYSFSQAFIMEFDTNKHYALWQAKIKDSVLSSPALYDGAVYFGSDSGKIYKITLPLL
ncbi:MAG: PQQ-binding-like beta-propeller repeat protein [Spirochaetaceae bacterium]|nr:PQQ-binding-like beta-propeller repeat protein [Spirochaetaceae bacterium]